MATKQDQFIANNLEAARKVQATYGIPVSVTLAQAALESGWGGSGLSSLFFNFFGIKGVGDAGATYQPTLEERNGTLKPEMASFARYSSPEAGFMGYGEFLTKNGRYTKALQAGSPEAVIDGIAAAGYATDSAYSSKVKGIMKDYNLTQYDDPSVKAPQAAPKGFWDIVNPSNAWDGLKAMVTNRWPEGSTMDRVQDKQKEVEEQAAETVTEPLKQVATFSIKTVIVVVLIVLLAIIIIQAIPGKVTPAGIVKGAMS